MPEFLENRNSCIRCGTCCLKGGPTLHHEDKGILLDGYVGHQHLVTLRKGEMAYDPVQDVVRPVDRELIKVRGKGNDWSCCLYDRQSSSCTVYEHRFLECRLLKCWDPSELLSVIGKETIRRTDIINAGDPIVKVIKTHERECPLDAVQELISRFSRKADKSKTAARLNELVRKDSALRSYAISELGLRKEYELFIFGRSLFTVIKSQGIPVHPAPGRSHDSSPPIAE